MAASNRVPVPGSERGLSPGDLRKWFDELKALSVPDAVAKIRALVGTDEAKDDSAEAASRSRCALQRRREEGRNVGCLSRARRGLEP